MEKMRDLVSHLEGYASCVNIDLQNRSWHTDASIPASPGWYFIRTTAPIEVLQDQQLWAATYTKKKSGALARVKNYDIAERAGRFRSEHAEYWNCSEVYSGMASKLRNRALEHTFPDPGTAGLALYRYPELAAYEWLFCFVTFERFKYSTAAPEMFLRLGEQIWRAKNGWPVLCSE